MAMTECKDCDYCYNEDGESQCRRYPPQPLPNGSGTIVTWPRVNNDGCDCCGEGTETG